MSQGTIMLSKPDSAQCDFAEAFPLIVTLREAGPVGRGTVVGDRYNDGLVGGVTIHRAPWDARG
jgi:hypothetical protein